MTPELLIRPHLGLGDGLLCNALVREHAKTHSVTYLAKPHNCASLAFMWRDEPNITVMPVAGDEEADEVSAMVKAHGRQVVALGYYGPKPFDRWKFDSEFYRQCKLDFQKLRWNNFRVSRQPSREHPLPSAKRFIVVVEDETRGFVLDRGRIRKGLKIVKPTPLPPSDPAFGTDANIFDWWGTLESAEEIHVFNSSMLILVDSLPCLNAKRLVFHHYVRAEGEVPSLVKGWERLT